MRIKARSKPKKRSKAERDVHTNITGATGAGKSQFLKHLVSLADKSSVVIAEAAVPQSEDVLDEEEDLGL